MIALIAFFAAAGNYPAAASKIWKKE